MKRITTLLTAIFCMAWTNEAAAKHVTVEMTEAGKLNTLVKETDCDSLTVRGA